MELQVLKNGVLTVSVANKGAEIQSVKSADNKEYIWEGNPDFWTGHAPVLFPICGGLKDDKFVYGGREYTLNKHGFGRVKTYEGEKTDETSVTYLLRSDDETLRQYPFEFELRITYELKGNSLLVSYNVRIMGEKPMYFSIGAHEAYACPGGIEGFKIVFEKEETLDAYVLDGNLLENNYVRIMSGCRDMPMKYDYFAVDALVFKNIKSRAVELTDGTRKIKVEFPGHDYFLIWTKPNAEYICIEPWCGIQDNVNSDYDITKKEGIIKLDGKDAYNVSHRITFD